MVIKGRIGERDKFTSVLTTLGVLTFTDTNVTRDFGLSISESIKVSDLILHCIKEIKD